MTPPRISTLGSTQIYQRRGFPTAPRSGSWTTGANFARAYVAATQARDSAKDISLSTTGFWTGGASDGSTLWFVADQRQSVARGLTWPLPKREIQAKDIRPRYGILDMAGFSDGTTLWFIVGYTTDDRNNCLPGERPKQAGSGTI